MANTTATIDTIALFKSAACAIYSGTQALSIVNAQIETLRKGKIVFGASKKTCQYRVQLGDAMKAAFSGKSEKTYSNYITAFIKAVNEGIPFSLSGSKGKAAPGADKEAQKGTEKTGSEKMLGALLTVWKLSDVGEDVLVEIETIMADAIPLIDAIQMVLQKAGEKLDGVESAE